MQPWKRRLGGWLVGLLLLVAMPGQAWAQQVTKEQREAAKTHFEAGAVLFYEEQYARALLEFQKAWALNPHPIIRYNQSLAHLRLGNIQEAWRMGLEAEQMPGLGENERLRNSARVRALGQVITAQDVASQVLQSQRVAIAVTDPSGSRPRSGDVPSNWEPDQGRRGPAASEESGLGALGWTGVTMTVLGAGLLGYAGYVDVSLATPIADYEEAARAGDVARYGELRDQIGQDTRQGSLALYAGGGLAAVGLTLWLTDALSDSSEDASKDYRVRLGPAPSPKGCCNAALLTIDGQF